MGSQTCFEQNGNKQMRVVVTFSFLKIKTDWSRFLYKAKVCWDYQLYKQKECRSNASSSNLFLINESALCLASPPRLALVLDHYYY